MMMPKWPDWETVREIGRGSFGGVYEIQKQIFGHTDRAALKVITIPKSKSDIDELYSDGYDTQSITKRYKNYLEVIVEEYNFMSELKGNPNIVYCDDLRYIQHDDGIGWDIYIKMELLTPLTDVYKTPVDEQQVIKLGIDMCNALTACKSKNIIHRDIKPQNIFVTDTGVFKLGDFGIAKINEKTTGGTKTGTYKYMAPEVYNNQPYGSSADLYSLGMVLYWMLNERRMPFYPLPPAVPTASQDEEARFKRMSGVAIPAPLHGSKQLKDIVLKACEFNPLDRFSSPSEMKSSLQRLISVNSEYETEYAHDACATYDSCDCNYGDYSCDDYSNSVSEKAEDENDNSIGASWDCDYSDYTGPQSMNTNFEKTDKTQGRWNTDSYKKTEPINSKAEPVVDAPNLDLSMDIYLTTNEISLGCQKEIYVALTGEKVRVHVPSGIQQGSVLRLQGKGRKDPVTGNRGNLMLTVKMRNILLYNKNQYKNLNWSNLSDDHLLLYIQRSSVPSVIGNIAIGLLILVVTATIAAISGLYPIGFVGMVAPFVAPFIPGYVSKNKKAAKAEWNKRHPDDKK